VPSPRQSLRKLIFASLAISLSLVSTAFARGPQGEEKPQPPKIIRKSGGVLQGSATRRVEPAYPPLAKAAQISGSVVVEVTIDEEGNVFSARAISGHPLLKDAAVAAARGWTFSPTRLQEVPVKVIGTITFNFNLDYSKDIEAIRLELEADPNSPELHYRLAELFRYDMQHEKAIEEYTQALSLKRDYVAAFIGLGVAHQAAGRLDEAIEAYKNGLSVKPPPAYAEVLNRFLGETYLKQDRNQEALEAFKQAVAIKPDLAEAHFQLGLTYLKIGDRESAMNEYIILKDKNEDIARELLRSIQKDN
jgi:TonB family protein